MKTTTPPNLRRRSLLALTGLALPAFAAARPDALPRITVYKTEFCGCCKAWISHLEQAGFPVEAINVADTSSWRAKLRMPDTYGSCHTAIVDGYAVEGHVPAADIKRLLVERPRAIGLAVPGMPVGSPGMEAGGHKDPYDVLLVTADGRSSVYRAYR
ncbi:MAG: DUF411 domain-containing protein [Pigmentiphaga sp.]|uniref:DUF411 domain-containing protein n=1 Tax=Pigmentiphaga sp. TaxID=1977564 RepID=UPI0029A8B07F|nr:DUF411 domain-containing protein [Pigmentiphaga sp.]MDX3907107.1 DUF411 domain-containing protein [Pigmentiphaga sp.]